VFPIKIAPGVNASPRGFVAGCFLVVLVRNPDLHDYERLAPDIERNQRPEVYHTVIIRPHIEHGKKEFWLGIIWEIAAAKVRLYTTSANHLAHCSVCFAEVYREDTTLGLVV
jgi:hypothetical protein